MYPSNWYRSVQFCALLVLSCCFRCRANLEDFPSCTGDVGSIGDGSCNSGTNNNEACGWDGGDCCECTCVVNPERDSSCGLSISCIDPDSGCADPRLLQYINCTGTASSIGDGRCYTGNNNEACGWDGGDCCECTCTPDCDSERGNGFFCLDPNSGCADPSLLKYTNCTGDVIYIGDGYCNTRNNNEACDWDGGDCCECTCLDGEYYDYCGYEHTPYFCKDPHSGCTDPLVGEYNNCSGELSTYGDGRCDSENNSQACGWDGGDCCECTCQGNNCAYRLLNDLFECLDPETAVKRVTAGCLDWPPASNPCPFQKKQQWKVETTSQARDLAKALNCSGGVFEVAWKGSVIVDHPISIFNGTVLNVTGVGSSAAIDGRGTLGLFTTLNASLYVSNMVLMNGKSTSGGAIAALGSKVSLSRAMFFGNVATFNGGAVFMGEGSTLTCGGETGFYDNSAVIRGGAISVSGRSTAAWTGGVVFANNSAVVGGAVDISFSSSVSWSTGGGATFFRNIATYCGGGLNVFAGSSARWEGESIFDGNTASYGGGGIFVMDSIATWEGKSIFKANTASGYGGGGIFVTDSQASWEGESTFEANTAFFGGAVYEKSHSSIAWTGDVTFSSNFAQIHGGAVYTRYDTTASWSAVTTFFNNTALSGGGVYICDGSTASWMGNTTFSKNDVEDGSGGALYVSSSSRILIEGSATFAGNTALYDGGALYLQGRASLEGDTTFSNNVAGDYGGAVYGMGGSNIYWSGYAMFSHNVANAYGGAVYITDNTTASWSAVTTFFHNYASYDGGGVYLQGGSTATWMRNTTFSKNDAGTRDGGALYVSSNSRILIEGNATFAGNTAITGDGGALFLEGRASLEGDITFADNVAGDLGGAICMAEGGSSISWSSDMSFLKNTANNGGALVAASELTISDDAKTTFLGNYADVYGGAVYISSMGVGPVFRGSHFISNFAQVGGAVYAVTSGTTVLKLSEKNPTTFQECNFTDNKANATGGAMSSAAGQDMLVNSIFIGNVAGTGGALQLAGSASIIDCVFERNIADSAGGPAVSNIGYLSGAINNTLHGNGLNCEKQHFLNFTEGSKDELWTVVCDGCHETCEGCDFGGTVLVPRCIMLSDAGIEHASSVGGVTTLEDLNIDRGYWRATSNSTSVLECYNRDACRGGMTGTAGFCREGYQGAYCSVCGKNYTASLNFVCTPCTARKWGIVVVSIVGGVSVVVGIAIVLYLVSGETAGSGRGVVDRVTRLVPLQSLKIIIVAWQIVTQFASVVNVTFPDVYQRFLDAVDVLNFKFSWVLSVSCVFSFDFHGQLLIATIGPIVGLLMLGITYVTAARKHRHSETSLRSIRHKHVSMVLLVTFLVYSSVSSMVFEMFACEVLDDGSNYLRADYRINCDSSKHKQFQIYAGFMILLYPVGIPLLFAGLLLKDRTVLRKEAERNVSSRVQPTSDLWKPYKPSRFYYEIIECARRISLTGAVVFIYPNTVAQIAVTIVVAFTFAMLSEALAPYNVGWDCWISRTGHVVVFMSMYIALLLKADVSSERTSSQRLLASVLVAAHICMVLTVLIEAVVMAVSVTTIERDEPRRKVTCQLSFIRHRVSFKRNAKIQGVLHFDGIGASVGEAGEVKVKEHESI